MPMYFFLSNLPLTDICFTSTIVPKMLVNVLTQSRVVTYVGSITMYIFLLFAMLDDFLLTMMAYDCFVAIYHPLYYIVIMNPRLCGLLLLVSWIMNALYSLLQSLMVLRLSCKDLKIPHFFCELNQMIQLACSENFLNKMLMHFVTVLLSGSPLTEIFYSHCQIVFCICGIASAQGKYKASTCESHFSVVALFYCTSLGVYLSSAATHSSHSSTVASVMSTVVTPMLNPFIYNLRNKVIKAALNKFIGMVNTQGIIFWASRYSHD
ncbi:putative olfactory receptor 7A2 [Pteropus vampyrus]|uniref:Olfactory receptor 7A2 n=1 Tax=Pteropus vampyrus TaxID=132908 RepID=A0A6P3RTE9_PTEVA|nr:putative olfactory receptor 7A2 [Pteropus vampyrus]